MTGSAADPDVAAQAVDRAVQRFGTTHGLVNNAGVTRLAMTKTTAQAQQQLVMDVHVNGSHCFMQGMGKHMPGACSEEGVEPKRAKTEDRAVRFASPGWAPGARRWYRRRPISRAWQPTPLLPRKLLERSRADDQTPGLIVKSSFDAGRRGSLGQISYAAAMFGMTMMAAREWANVGIRCNAVCFGVVETPMTETVRTDERFLETHLAQIPLGRWSWPEEAATPVCFLLSKDSSYTTNQVQSVNGGFATTM